jgi:translation initiation factor IF-3
MTAGEAIRKAREQELDVVEINPKTDPPVVKIMDYGQFRYQKEKEMRIKKAHQHVVDIKGIRMSLRIGKHDFDIRKTQAVPVALSTPSLVAVRILLEYFVFDLYWY